MRSTNPLWCLVFCLSGCGGDGRTPPTQPESPGVDGGAADPMKPSNDPGTDTGEPVGPLALAAPPPGSAGGGSGGLGGFGGLGAIGGKSPIGSAP
jgi:hypothetical protein